MPQLSLLAVAIIAIINAIVFFLIIRAAVSSGAETAKRMKHVWAQTELLIAIARKSGVDDGSLRAITEHLK